MRGLVLRAFLILAAGALLGIAVNAVSPRRIPWLRPPRPTVPAGDQIVLDQARQLWERGGAIFLDARAPREFADGHIAGALSLPIADFDALFPSLRPRLSADEPLVLYCDGEHCDDSIRLLQRLRAVRCTNARVLVNGWTLWRRAGLPTTKGEGK